MKKTTPRSSKAAVRPGRLIALAGILLGVFAILAPLLPSRLAFLILGILILLFGLLQNIAGFALRDPKTATSWFSRGGVSILTGFLVIAMPRLTFGGLAVVLGVSWMLSGASEIATAIRHRAPDWTWASIDGLASFLLGVAIAVQWPVRGLVSVGLFVGLRCISAGWSILAGRRAVAEATVTEDPDLHPDHRLRLAAHQYIGRLRSEFTREEAIRERGDRAWCWLFLFTFFVIHVSRMDTTWNLVGMLSPAGAVVGDAFLSIIFAYGLVAPLSLSWRSTTRPFERKAWRWYLKGVDHGNTSGFQRRITHWWIVGRLRAAVSRSQARGSVTSFLGWGLRSGLPAAAILMALTPLWGVSWFFNTETWVTGAWEMYAEERTDSWRAHMVDAVKTQYGNAANEPDFFRVIPNGLPQSGDFNFIVIGDTGEGDMSQHILRDQLLDVGQKPEVKFLVVSSDVIYPAGAMKDYEAKFYAPFKGFHKPIYAVPGNHDWYDALESFTANFLDPEAAGAALRGRREAELKLTTTTKIRSEEMIRQAQHLRQQYQIQAAQQRAPYFEIVTDQFYLVCVDTGIKRRLDDDQFRWLEGALGRAGDRFKMAILGHPLYAAGRYQGANDEEFARLHALLKQHRVKVVMAGDTHDFEYYKEDDALTGDVRSMYHFVNGGGGAYLSIGTALDWPKQAPVAECGSYPRGDMLATALDARMPILKGPLWFWVRHFNAWPSSVETLSAAFDYDLAPFFQSFMEVRVDVSAGFVRYWLYGANGRLRWRDLYVHDGRIHQGQAEDDFVEFSFPLGNGGGNLMNSTNGK